MKSTSEVVCFRERKYRLKIRKFALTSGTNYPRGRRGSEVAEARQGQTTSGTNYPRGRRGPEVAEARMGENTEAEIPDEEREIRLL